MARNRGVDKVTEQSQAGFDQDQSYDRRAYQEEEADEAGDPKIKVRVLGSGHRINGHPMSVGHIVELPTSEVELMRERGYAFEAVPESYNGPLYDHSEPWTPPERTG